MANELKPCPFCQRQPLVSENNVPGNWYANAECVNGKCPERPRICGDDLADVKAKWNNGDAWNTRPAAPVDGLETKAWNCTYPTYGHFTLKEREAKQAIDEGASVEELVTRSQAEAIIAAKDYLLSVSETVAQQLQNQIVTLTLKAEDLEADNAALTARVKELEQKKEMLVWAGEQSIAEIEALETQLAAAEKVREAAIDLNEAVNKDFNVFGAQKKLRAALEASHER